MMQLGACPSEAAAAGNTPQEVKQSLIGAGFVLLSVIPFADILDFGAAAADTGTAAEEGATAAGDAPGELPKPTRGQTLYRIYGGDSKAGGASWSPIDPRTVSNYRDIAGLPSGGASGATNTGRFAIEGELLDPSKVVLQQQALPLDGMKGGIPEYIIPNWMENGAIDILRVSGVNPEF